MLPLILGTGEGLAPFFGLVSLAFLFFSLIVLVPLVPALRRAWRGPSSLALRASLSLGFISAIAVAAISVCVVIFLLYLSFA